MISPNLVQLLRLAYCKDVHVRKVSICKSIKDIVGRDNFVLRDAKKLADELAQTVPVGSFSWVYIFAGAVCLASQDFDTHNVCDWPAAMEYSEWFYSQEPLYKCEIRSAVDTLRYRIAAAQVRTAYSGEYNTQKLG